MIFKWKLIYDENDHGIVIMMISKIPILHKPFPMKHRQWNYYET
jgi:hypothetical protein